MKTHRDIERFDHRVKLWLLAVSLVTIAVLAAAALQENVFQDWRQIRAEYRDRLEAKATDDLGRTALDLFDVHIDQSYLPDLHTVDRCGTCHAGIEDPRMVDEPQPFTTHPGRMLEIHDPARFGCSTCHQGQGRATETADAHGTVAHWETPLLPTPFLRSTCTRCHSEESLHGPDGLLALADHGAPGPGTALLVRGRSLWTEKGCAGCHATNGKGGTLGPELVAVGDRVPHDFDFSHLSRDVPRTPAYWLEEHFADPQSVSPGSRMPAIEHRADATALTAYMLSLRHPIADIRPWRQRDDALRDDRELYVQYCSACHGADGRGGDVPSLHTPMLNNLDTLAVASDDFLRTIIQRGRSGTDMPAWAEGHGNLSTEEIDGIVAHIRTWEPKGAEPGDASARAGDPERGASLYRGLCAGCHGLAAEGGIGNGLVSATFLAVADDRFLADTIVNGRPGTAMPSWKHLSTGEVSDLLAWMRAHGPAAPTREEVEAASAAVPAQEAAHVGKRLYALRCASCHGKALEGGIGPSLVSTDFLRAVDDAYLYRAIVEGRPSTAMPAWSHLRAEDVAALITYLRSLQRGEPLDLDFEVARGDYVVGEVHYRISCAKCHGEEGEGGTGPQLANPTFLSSASDAQLFHWIGRGRAGTAMQGFLREEQGPVELRVDQIADVIAYLRHIGARRDLPLLRTSPGDTAIGAHIYAGQCAGCHGPDGEGASAPQLNNPTFLRTASDGYLAATIVLGRTHTAMQPMVLGGQGIGQIPPENVRDIVAFLRKWETTPGRRRPRRIAEVTPTAIAAGRESYGHYCASCHGADGRGGWDEQERFAPALNNPEFLDAASDGFLLATIARGREGTPMRPFGEGADGIVALSGNQISNIVAFVRSWQQPTDDKGVEP